MNDFREIPLAGGNMEAVVRVGETVRRVSGPWTPAVHALLEASWSFLCRAAGLAIDPALHGLGVAVGGEVDRVRSGCDVGLGFAPEQRVLTLQRGDGLNGVGTAEDVDAVAWCSVYRQVLVRRYRAV